MLHLLIWSPSYVRLSDYTYLPWKFRYLHHIVSMLSAPRALLVSLLASGALAFPPFGPGSGSHGYGSGSSSVGRAIYLQTNEADNSVVAIPISADGTLSGGHLVATGGQGSTIAVNGSASSPQTPDSLGSQSSVTVAGNVCRPPAPLNPLSMSPRVLTNVVRLCCQRWK